MAGTLGIEPRLTESKSVVLPLHNIPTKLVDRKRIELLISGCKPDVLPLALTARKKHNMDAPLRGRLGLRLPCRSYRGAVTEALYT